MKKYYPLLIVSVLALACVAAALVAGHRIKDYWGVTTLDDTDVFILERTNAVPNTNVNIHVSDLRFITTNGLATITYVTNLFFISSNFAISSDLWTNDNGVITTSTNLPIALGTNALGMSSRLYIQDQITNDSMSSVIVMMVPRTGTGTSRNGVCFFMTRGDAVGAYSHGLYALNQSTSSNGFGAYWGSTPFGLVGAAQSDGPGDSVGVLGVNVGTNKTRYGLAGIAGGDRSSNTNIGVFGHGSTNSSVATGVYAELGNGTATATDAVYPFTSALTINNRQTAKRLATAFTNSVYEVWSLRENGHMQLNSNEVYSLVQGTNILFITNGTTLTVHGTAVSSGGALPSGSTNFINLSPQAIKLPTTNYPGIDAGWQDWEVLYYKTNAEGSIASLSGTWQFIVPQDYATNTMKVRLYSVLSTTNGPNSSNTIFRASCVRVPPDNTTDIHTSTVGTKTSGTITWAASISGTNKIQSTVINMNTASALAAGDLCILQIDRDAATDTFGGTTALVGIQVEYTRP